jgi:dipeptidyl aminopeptidase/acylaminoacyl peptidase
MSRLELPFGGGMARMSNELVGDRHGQAAFPHPRFVMKLCTLLLAVAISSAPGQTTDFRQVFSSDSIIPAFAQTSPDGKWIVIARSEGERAASLWLAPTAGGPPVRLTSSGYNDSEPCWFAGGDRIVFMSTRPNRNGGRQQYLMTLDIDPATGRARGAARQVTSEPVATRGRPTPDGRWMLYVTPGEPALVKIVPSNGGVARTITQGTHPVNALTISPDGRHVFYGQQAGVGGRRCRQDGYGCTSFTIKRVAIEGGTPVDVATESHRIRVLAADPRYVQHQVSASSGMSNTGVWELRDPTGRALGRIEFPDGVAHLSFTGDGWGLVGINRVEERSIRVVSVPGGTMRTVTTTGRRWPEAWMPDGSAIITDRAENGRIVVEVTSLDGKPLAQHTLPANVTNSGWSSSVGPWFSYQTGPQGLSALNVLTGATKPISNTGFCCAGGRGGMDQDGASWLYHETSGNQRMFKSTDPATGGTVTLRTFPSPGARGQTIAAGSRLAWLEARGDSLDLMVSENTSGPARKVMSARSTLRDASETIAWSWKGDRIAVCGGATGQHGTLTIVTVPTSPSTPVSQQNIPLGSATDCWGPQWQPDDSGLVLIVTLIARTIRQTLATSPCARAQSCRSSRQMTLIHSGTTSLRRTGNTSPTPSTCQYHEPRSTSRASGR